MISIVFTILTRSVLCFYFSLFIIFFSNVAYAEKITVLLDWFPNPNHAPLFVAKQKGFFKEENLDVDLIGPADPTDPPKLVAAGKADIAITYQPQFLEQKNQGLPLAFIGILINQPLNCLVVLNESKIKTLQDLKGKKIGYSSASTFTLNKMLASAGLSLSDVELVNVHYDLTQALLSKKIDAATGMMRNFEFLQLSLLGHSAKAFYPEQHGIPAYNELIFIARNDSASDIRFARFLKALIKSVHYLKKHPEETWLEFVKNHPELNDKLNHAAWLATIPCFPDKPSEFNKKEWLQFTHFMQENGLIHNH